MNSIGEIVLKGFRKIYLKLFSPTLKTWECVDNPNEASDMLFDLLKSGKPCMIARFGSVELNAFANWYGINTKPHNVWKFISGRIPQWWWNMKGLEEMETNAGFFPSTPKTVARFSELMYQDISLIDVLGSWRPEERFFKEELAKAQKVLLLRLEPYWSTNPWSRILEGKKVLVVHPFSDDIISQYTTRRELLFDNPLVLPQFKEFHVLKAVQSNGGGKTDFKDWFEALDWMKNEMDKIDYEIALIGCGAYGMPLAAHAKRTGHQAVHLGGALQLLFGIKGKRWEDPNYNPIFNYNSLFNKYWVYPNPSTRPVHADKIEGATYW